MPFKSTPFHEQVKQEDEGFLGGVLKNVKGAGEFLDPRKLAPALIAGIGGGAASTAKEVLRAPTTLAGSLLTGGEAKPLEESPLSFLVNTEYLKNAQNPNLSPAELFRAQLKQLSPLAEAGAAGVAETGARGGAELASALSRTGKFGDFQTAEQMLQAYAPESGVHSYSQAAQQGQLFPTLVQDITAIAPAARGAGGALEAAGAEGAGQALARAATAVERAPMAPISAPLRAGYEGAQRAALGETAFPGLAGIAERPTLGAPARLAERTAQAAGEAFRGTAARGEAMRQVGALTEENAPQIKALEKDISTTLEPSHKAALEAAHTDLLQELEAQGRNEAKFNIQRAARERVAAKEGIARREVTEEMIPKGFSDEAISKQLQGLDPAKADHTIIKAIDYVTGKWKKGVLPLNPAWQAGNIVNNSMTAAVYGGVDPVWFGKNRSRILKEIANPTEGTSTVLGRGQAAEFTAPEARTALGRGIEKGTSKAYALNERVDDIAHASVYLKELDRLKGEGIGHAEAQKLASEKALKTMGDFQNMSATERNVIRRVVPFYAWSKHATKFSLREMMENPVRTQRLALAAEKLGPQQPEGENLSFLKGAIPLGQGKFLNLPGGLEQAGAGAVESPLLNPKAALGAVNPMIQQLAAAGGLDLRKGQKLEPGPDQGFLSAAAGYETQQIPLLKTIADLVERSPAGRGENVIKGGTRAPLVSGGRPIAETKQDLGPLPAPLLKFLAGTSLDQPDIAGANARETKETKTEKKKAKSYQKALKKKAK